MVGELANIKRCLDLVEADIAGAVASREKARALLAHLEAVSAPNTGTAKVLLVVARMATTACDWIDGDLVVDLVAIGDTTRLDVGTELGGGMRERVFAPLVFQAPLEEFARAIERVPHAIAPLRVGTKTSQRIAFGATEATRRTSLPPPPIEISADSLFLRPGAPPLPKDGEEGTTPASLPVIVAATPSPKAAPRGASDLPPGDLDSGWDD